MSVKIKKALKFICFWLVILGAIDVGMTAAGCAFLDAILTPCAGTVVKVMSGAAALIVLVCAAFGVGCCGCGCHRGDKEKTAEKGKEGSCCSTKKE